MLGFFLVMKTPARGQHFCTAKSECDEAITGNFYLPFLNRNGQSNIKKDSRFFGILDERSGYGALLAGLDDADFQNKISGGLEVGGDISTLTGDVKAGAVSLKTHIHTDAEGRPTSSPAV